MSFSLTTHICIIIFIFEAEIDINFYGGIKNKIFRMQFTDKFWFNKDQTAQCVVNS